MNDDQPIMVTGTRRSFKEMADGTIRVQIDVDLQHKSAFLKGFNDIDCKVLLFRMKSEATMSAAKAEEEAAQKTNPVGPIAKSAVMLCKNPTFRSWYAAYNRVEGPYSEDECRGRLLVTCGIMSRKELDSNPAAAERFHAIRKAFLDA